MLPGYPGSAKSATRVTRLPDFPTPACMTTRIRSDRKISTPSSGIVPAPKNSRIPTVYLRELTAIWDADKRLPSPESRRAWALARGLQPSKVNNWWYRKKTAAKRHGIHLPMESYELPVVPVPTLPEFSPSPFPETPPPPNALTYCGRIDFGPNLGYLKKEEALPKYEFEVTLLSDDPNFGPNPISSGSSDANGSLDFVDILPPGSTGTPSTPYTPSEPSFFALNSPINYNPSAYIHSMVDIGYLLDASYSQFDFDGFPTALGSGSGSSPILPVSIEQNTPLCEEHCAPEECKEDSGMETLPSYTNEFLWNQDDPDTCSPGSPASEHIRSEEATQAWNDLEEVADEGPLWHPRPEIESGTEHVANQTASELVFPDPSNLSWCLGGTRFSQEGFFLGLCECSGLAEGSLFKRFVGCTGPWDPEQYRILGLDWMANGKEIKL